MNRLDNTKDENTKLVKTNQNILEMPVKKKQEIDKNIPGWAGDCHQFDRYQVGAIQAAWFAGRPLLVRGAPGLGKSQLAPALASYLNFQFHSITIHADTEINDLLYRVDHVKRLSDSQVSGATDTLDKYVDKGILWKAIAPETPPELTNITVEKENNKYDGNLVLIDEIDKADASLPNGLLEVLNNKTINVSLLGQTIKQGEDNPVFVVITSNDDRELPAAFLRRCAILDLYLKEDETEGADQLMSIYQAHKKRIEATAKKPWFDNDRVRKIAIDVIKHRANQKSKNEYASGTSEFLDLLRALSHFQPENRDIMEENLFKVLVKKRNQSEQKYP